MEYHIMLVLSARTRKQATAAKHDKQWNRSDTQVERQMK